MMKPLYTPEIKMVLDRFIRDYFASSGATGVIIGLSGGLDSTVILKLCVDSLGPGKVKGLLLPESSTPSKNMCEIEAYASELGVVIETIDISTIVKEMAGTHTRETQMSLGNLKSRARMVILFHHAGIEKRLVMGTSNKSELLTGYYTKYGDGAADISPIGDLYKTQVRELARDISVPAHFIDRIPSGDLWDGQSDEDELGISYEALDRILLGIEMGLGDTDIVKRTVKTPGEVAHVRQLVKNSIHKRRLGLIPKIGLRTVGLDWREA